MPTQTMKIIKAIVLQDDSGPDYVYLHTDLPDPFPKMQASMGFLVITFQVEAETGISYVRKNFDLDPEVVQRSNYQTLKGSP